MDSNPRFVETILNIVTSAQGFSPEGEGTTKIENQCTSSRLDPHGVLDLTRSIVLISEVREV